MPIRKLWPELADQGRAGQSNRRVKPEHRREWGVREGHGVRMGALLPEDQDGTGNRNQEISGLRISKTLGAG